jgi:hypothetical protein
MFWRCGISCFSFLLFVCQIYIYYHQTHMCRLHLSMFNSLFAKCIIAALSCMYYIIFIVLYVLSHMHCLVCIISYLLSCMCYLICIVLYVLYHIYCLVCIISYLDNKYDIIHTRQCIWDNTYKTINVI